MGLPILLRRLDPCATLWASCAALGHGLTAIAAHAGEVRRAFADSDRRARRRQTDRRHRPVVRRLQRAGDGGPLTRSRDRARRHAPWAPRLTAGENSPRNCGRPAVRCSGIVALRTRFSFWPRYCKLSTAGSKTGNLESLLTRSHRNCDSNCNFRWADRDTCHGTRPARGAGRDHRPSARRTPDDRVGREAAMKPARRTDPLRILLWIVVVLVWIGAIGSRHSAHLALLQ